MTTNNNDYIVDIGLEDKGSLERVLGQLKEIDQTIAGTVKEALKLSQQFQGLGKNHNDYAKVKAELKEQVTLLKELNGQRDIFAKSAGRAADTSYLRTNQTSQLKAELESFKKALRQSSVSMDSELQSSIKRLQDQQRKFLVETKKQQAEMARLQTLNTLSSAPHPQQHLRNLSRSEVASLGAFASQTSKKSYALGDKEAAAIADKALKVIQDTLAERLAPALKDRLGNAKNLLGNANAQRDFVATSTPKEVADTVKLLRKQASQSSLLSVNNPEAQSYAKLAQELQDLTKVIKPAAANLARVTREINANGVDGLTHMSERQLRSTQATVNRGYNKAISEGRTGDAQELEKALVKLSSAMEVITNPSRQARYNSLRSVAASGDFNAALTDLLRGKSQSGVEQLLRDSKTLYRQDSGLYGEAENLRQLTEALKAQVTAQNEARREIKRNPQAHLANLTQQINDGSIGDLTHLSERELRSTKGILNRGYNKAIGEGRTGDAQSLEKAITKLSSALESITNPTRQARLDSLRRVASSGDIDGELSKLLRGKSQSSVEQLLKDSKALYSQDREVYGEAEDLRRLTDALKAQVTAQNELRREQRQQPKAATKPLTPNQELSAFEAVRVSEMAQSRYAGSIGTLAQGNTNVTTLQNLKEEAQLLQKAQMLRLERAKVSGGDVKAEGEALNLLKKQTRELNAQLRIEQELENQAKRKNSERYQANKRVNAEEAARARNSPEALDQNVYRNLNQNERKREIDGGADMFKNQLMLLRNYAVMGAAVGGAASTSTFAVNLDSSFAQLQSILALTNNEMDDMKGKLIQISELTKFDAVQVVDAGVILGQAGLSKEQITASLEGITLFATAVGTDLKSAVDLATSALGVYNIEASRMPDVVDKLTISINKSKLNMDKLSLGLQYAGNIAEQSNVSFEETVAALAAMANSGIKSGSTLGTGLRQILISLQKPSEAFRAKIQDLGLSMSDLDLNTHSLLDIMETLSGSGFTIVDAMQTMEVRTASAFSAFSNNLDVARNMTLEMENSGAAATANAVQMEALANQWDRFASITKSIVYDALEPLMASLSGLLKMGGDLLTTYRGVADLLGLVASGLITIQGIRIAKGAIGLAGRLAGGVGKAGETLAPTAAQTISKLSTADKASVAATIAPWIMRFLGGPAVMATGLGLTLAMYAGTKLSKQAKLDDALDRARTTTSLINQRQEKTSQGIRSIDQLTTEAYYRRSTLENPDSDAMSKFVKKLNEDLRSLGFYMEETNPPFETMIEKLKDLRKTMVEISGIDLQRAAIAAQTENNVELERLASQKRGTAFSSVAPTPLIRNLRPTLGQTRGPAVTDYDIMQQSLFRLDGDLAIALNRGNANGLQSYISKVSGLNSKSKPEDITNALTQNRQFASQIQSFLLNNPKDILTGNRGLSETEAKDLIEGLQSLVAELRGDENALKNIQVNFEKIAQSKNDEQIADIANRLGTEFQPQYQAAVADIGKRRTDLIEDRDLSPLRRYEGLKEINAEFKKTTVELLSALKDQAKVSQQSSGLPAGALSKILEASGLPALLNSTSARLTEAQRDAGKPALKDFRRRTNAELTNINDQIEAQTTARNEGANETVINRATQILDDLIKRKNKLELDLKLMQAEIDNNEEQAQNVRDSADEELATSLDNNKVLGDRQLARYTATRNFKDRNFNVGPANESNNRAMADVARTVFSEYQAASTKAMTQAMTTVEQLRVNTDTARARADKAQVMAGDTGVPMEWQMENSRYAAAAIGELFETIKAAIEVESSALQASIDADTKEREARLKAAEGMTDGSPLKKELLAESKDLEVKIAASKKRLAELNRDEAQAMEDALLAIRDLNGQMEMRYYSERPNMSEDRRKLQSQIYGTEYRTDQQVLKQERGQQLAPAATDFSKQVSNAWDAVGKNVGKAYDGFDPLVQGVEGLTDLLTSAGDTAGSFFAQFAKGAISGGDAIKGFAITVLESLSEMAAKIAMNQLMSMLLQSVFGAGFGGGFGDASIGATGPTMVAWNGGPVRRYATGGLIPMGPTSITTRDSTYAHVAPGEYILRQKAVKALGLDTVNFLNQQDETSLASMRDITPVPAGKEGGQPHTVNVWVVSEDEKPTSIEDGAILVVVNKALSRNSPTKKLVKQIQLER